MEMEICRLFKTEDNPDGSETGITCPFCGDASDYDLQGLKYHLRRYCKKYEDTEDLL